MRKYFGLSAVIVALDLYTKHLIEQAFQFGEKLTFTSFFDLVRYHNEGSAFGFLNDAGGWQKWFFAAISVVAVIVMIYLIRSIRPRNFFAGALP